MLSAEIFCSEVEKEQVFTQTFRTCNFKVLYFPQQYTKKRGVFKFALLGNTSLLFYPTTIVNMVEAITKSLLGKYNFIQYVTILRSPEPLVSTRFKFNTYITTVTTE